MLTPLERELLDGLAEIIAADILRVRGLGETTGPCRDDLPEAGSC